MSTAPVQQPVGRMVHFQHGSTPAMAFIRALHDGGNLDLKVIPPGNEPEFTTVAPQAPDDKPALGLPQTPRG